MTVIWETPVVLTAASASKQYDNVAQTDDTDDAIVLPESFECVAEAAGSQRWHGSSAIVVSSYTIHPDGGDVTASLSWVAETVSALA